MPLYRLGDLAPVIDPTAYVHPEAVVIGNVEIGPESSVWPCAVLRGDTGLIRIGARTSVQDGAVIHTTAVVPTIVGDDCTIGHLAHLEGCTVESGTLIGTGAVVLHRAVVRSGALVAAGAVVTNGTEVPAGALATGVPATMRPGAANADGITHAAQHYVENGRHFREHLERID